MNARLADKLLETMHFIAYGVDDPSERLAGRYSYAWVLLELLRFDDVERECTAAIRDSPDRGHAFQGILARSFALQGNLEAALSIMRSVNSNPKAGAFVLAQDELERIAHNKSVG